MERYILVQITIESGSKEKLANEWYNTITSWLSLGSSIFDLLLEKKRGLVLQILGKSDPKPEKRRRSNTKKIKY